MIKNDIEFDLTSSSLESFKARKIYLSKYPYSQEIQIEINGIEAMMHDLEQQIELYQAIKNGEIMLDKIESIEEIPLVLTGKRIQLNYTQANLAEQLDIPVEEYIRLENEDFYGIEPELFIKITRLMSLENPNNIFERDYIQTVSTMESNIKELNLKHKILPFEFKEIKLLFKDNQNLGAYYIEKIIEAFKRIFSIRIQDTLSETQISTNIAVAFKHKTNVSEDNLTITTGYAAYIAGILAKQMNETIKINMDPIEIRNSVIDKYGEVTLDGCLDFIWKLNIVVLPLNMRGSFHGACFDFESTKAIVLSQQNKSVSRWKFDLLHEFYHALTMDYNAYIERTDIMDQNDEEEKRASDFASYIIFGQEMESILQLIIERSDSQIERMKSTIAAVATEFAIDLDDLANYVAFRVSRRPISLWGVAENLQTDKRYPINILLRHLYENISFNQLDFFEFDALQNALNQEVNFLG